MMKNEIINFLWNEGDGNITLQGVTADNINITQVISFKELRDSFLLEKDNQIKKLEETLQLTLELLDTTKELNKIKIIELTNKVDNAILERTIAEKQLKHLIEKLSKTDLTKITGIQKQAFDFFFQKDIKNALLILDDSDLDEELEKAEELERQARDAKKKNAEARIFKAGLLIIQSDFDEAKKNFNKAVYIFPSYNTHIEYALYLDDSGYLDEAKHEYENALNLTFNPIEIAEVKNFLGVLNGKQGNFNLSYSFLNEALQIYEKIAISDKSFINNIVGISQNLATLFSNQYNVEKSLFFFEKSLENWRELLSIQPNEVKYLYGLSNALHEYGLLNRRIGNYDIAINSYKESVGIYHKLILINPIRFEPELAQTLDTLVVAYSYRRSNNDLEEAHKCQLESNNIWRNLSNKNPKFLIGLSLNLHNGGQLKAVQGNIDEAITLYNECLEIRRTLIKKSINVVETKNYMLKTLINLGNLLALKSEDIEKAESLLLEALEIGEDLIKINNKQFVLDLSMVKTYLSDFYTNFKPIKDLAISHALETIDNLSEFPITPDSQRCLDICYKVLNHWGYPINSYWNNNINWS